VIPFKEVVGAIMADNPETSADESFIPVDGMVEAPIIYFEVCPTFGNNGGLINLMLAAGLIEPTGGNRVRSRIKAVAHLRMTATATIGLRDTIDKALLMCAPVENPGGKAN
jgi:hypothetical protein